MKRKLQAELMDDPGIDPTIHRAALRGLARINALSFAASTVTAAIMRLAEDRPNDSNQPPLRVLDVACGGGDMLRRIGAQLHTRGVDAELTAMDISPTAIEQARRNTSGHCAFVIGDALSDPLPPHDVVMCSLFLHHLSRPEAVSLLRAMRQAARLGVVVNDLRRTALGLAAAWVGTRVLSRSRVVHQDGPASVRAAWTGDELAAIAHDAGLRHAALHYHITQRMTLSWKTDHDGARV